MQFMMMSIAEVDGCYSVPNISARGYQCKTNLPPCCVMRGGGRPQAVFFVEHCIRAVADYLNVPATQVTNRNICCHLSFLSCTGIAKHGIIIYSTHDIIIEFHHTLNCHYTTLWNISDRRLAKIIHNCNLSLVFVEKLRTVYIFYQTVQAIALCITITFDVPNVHPLPTHNKQLATK